MAMQQCFARDAASSAINSKSINNKTTSRTALYEHVAQIEVNIMMFLCPLFRSKTSKCEIKPKRKRGEKIETAYKLALA